MKLNVESTKIEIGSHMPDHTYRDYKADELVQGFHGRRIDFDYRPYEKRTPAARADYDELRKDLIANGMRNPLITHNGHVLVGQRRYEIMIEITNADIYYFVGCIEILEDVSEWWKDDLPKLEALKAHYYT